MSRLPDSNGRGLELAVCMCDLEFTTSMSNVANR